MLQFIANFNSLLFFMKMFIVRVAFSGSLVFLVFLISPTISANLFILDTGENADIRATHVDTVAKLQAKKTSLESTIQDRTQELKLLCIKEAELTGVLPPEIPLEPGETPPTFRRRVGTAFQYPENLLNSSRIYKSKEVSLL